MQLYTKGKNSLYWSRIDKLNKFVHNKDYNVIPYMPDSDFLFVDFYPTQFPSPGVVKVYINDVYYQDCTIIDIVGTIYFTKKFGYGVTKIKIKDSTGTTELGSGEFVAINQYLYHELESSEELDRLVEKLRIKNDLYFDTVRDTNLYNNFGSILKTRKPTDFSYVEYRDMLDSFRDAYIEGSTIGGIKTAVRDITGVDPDILPQGTGWFIRRFNQWQKYAATAWLKRASIKEPMIRYQNYSLPYVDYSQYTPSYSGLENRPIAYTYLNYRNTPFTVDSINQVLPQNVPSPNNWSVSTAGTFGFGLMPVGPHYGEYYAATTNPGDTLTISRNDVAMHYSEMWFNLSDAVLIPTPYFTMTVCNGTHKAIVAYNAFGIQLQGVTKAASPWSGLEVYHEIRVRIDTMGNSQLYIDSVATGTTETATLDTTVIQKLELTPTALAIPHLCYINSIGYSVANQIEYYQEPTDFTLSISNVLTWDSYSLKPANGQYYFLEYITEAVVQTHEYAFLHKTYTSGIVATPLSKTAIKTNITTTSGQYAGGGYILRFKSGDNILDYRTISSHTTGANATFTVFPSFDYLPLSGDLVDVADSILADDSAKVRATPLITIYSGQQNNFTIKIKVNNSIRTVTGEEVVKNLALGGTDLLANRYLTSTTVTIPGYTETTHFTVDRYNGTITWLSGAQPAVGTTYLVTYLYYVKEAVESIVEKVKPAHIKVKYVYV